MIKSIFPYLRKKGRGRGKIFPLKRNDKPIQKEKCQLNYGFGETVRHVKYKEERKKPKPQI